MNLLDTPLPAHDRPWASIIILNYNGRRFLNDCVRSVLTSDYPFYEIIVVDNASTDDSVIEFEKAFLPAHSDKIAIVKNPANWLSTKGLNVGIRAVRGEIIVLLDNDTSVRADWLSRLVQPLIDDPGVGVTGSKLLFGDQCHVQHAGGWIEENGLAQHYGYRDVDNGQWRETHRLHFVTGAATAIRKSVFEECGGGLDELFPIYFEDCDICWNARRLGYEVLFVPDSVAIHHESATMKIGSDWYLYNYHRGRCRFVFKNFPIKNLLFDFPRAEWRWFWRHGRKYGQWRSVLKGYAALLPALPKIAGRRIARRFAENGASLNTTCRPIAMEARDTVSDKSGSNSAG